MDIRKQRTMKKADIVKALKDGKELVVMHDRYKLGRYFIDNTEVNTISVKAACRELNNGEEVGSSFLLGNYSHPKVIYYTCGELFLKKRQPVYL